MKSVSIFHKEVYKARNSLCMNQTSWEMKIFDLLPILHAGTQGDALKMPCLNVTALL